MQNNYFAVQLENFILGFFLIQPAVVMVVINIVGLLLVCVQFTKVAEHLLSTVDDSSRSFRTNAAIHECEFS